MASTPILTSLPTISIAADSNCFVRSTTQHVKLYRKRPQPKNPQQQQQQQLPQTMELGRVILT